MYAIFDTKMIYGVADSAEDAIAAWQAEGGTKEELWPIGGWWRTNELQDGRTYLGRASKRIAEFMDTYDGGEIPAFGIVEGLLDFK